MNCKDMTKEELDELLVKYVTEELDESDVEDIEMHIFDCDECSKQVLAISKVMRISKQNFIYEDLCAAYDNKEWQDVIRLGDELEGLGYAESVHPTLEKIRIAESELKLTKSDHRNIESRGQNIISLIIDDVEERYTWENDEIVHLVDNDDKKELKIIIDNEIIVDLTLPEKEELLELEDQSEGKLHFESEDFTINIYLGMFDYKIVITKK